MYINAITQAQEAINRQLAMDVWLGRVFLAGCLVSCILASIAFFYYRIPEVIGKLRGRNGGKKMLKIPRQFMKRKNMSRDSLKHKKELPGSVLSQDKEPLRGGLSQNKEISWGILRNKKEVRGEKNRKKPILKKEFFAICLIMIMTLHTSPGFAAISAAEFTQDNLIKNIAENTAGNSDENNVENAVSSPELYTLEICPNAVGITYGDEDILFARLKQGTGTEQRTDDAQGTGTAQGADTAQGTDAAQGTDTAQGTGTAQGTDAAQGTGTAQGTETKQGTDTSQEESAPGSILDGRFEISHAEVKDQPGMIYVSSDKEKLYVNALKAGSFTVLVTVSDKEGRFEDALLQKNLTIKPKSLDLSFTEDSIEIEYQKLLGAKAKSYDFTAYVEPVTLLDGSRLETSAYPKIKTDFGDGSVGEHKNALSFAAGSGSPPENYIFSEKTYACKKSVTLTPESLTSIPVKLAKDSFHVYEKDGDLRQIYFGKDTSGSFVITDSKYQKLYLACDKISGKDGQSDGEKSADDTAEKLSDDRVENSAASAIYPSGEEIDFTDLKAGSYRVVLSTEDRKKYTKPFTVTFIEDTAAPSCQICIGERLSGSNQMGSLQDIPFSFFFNSYDKKVILSSSDQKNGSGVQKTEYYIYKGVAEDFDDTSLRAVFDRALRSGNVIKTYSNPFSLAYAPGYYLVFARVTDQVGNEALYASDGVVFERLPAKEVSLTYDREPAVTDYRGADLFSGDVRLKARASEDDGGPYSGLYALTARVNQGAAIDLFTREDVGLTLSQIRQQYMNLPNTSAQTDYVYLNGHSGKYTVDLSAFDAAGNESHAAENRTIIIDREAPQITLTDGSYTGKKRHTKADVKLGIGIWDLSLDQEKGLTVTISYQREGASAVSSGTYSGSIEEIEKIFKNIRFDYKKIKDDADGEEHLYSYKMTIKAGSKGCYDGRYKISLQAKDRVGRLSEKENLAAFTIDTTRPVLSVIYRSYPNAKTIEAGSSADKPAYLGEDYSSFRGELTVKESHVDLLNFKIMASLASGTGSSAGTGRNVGTGSSAGTDADASRSSFGDLIGSYDAGDLKGGRILTKTCKADGRYVIEEVSCSDLAGNAAVSLPAAYITLDKTKPRGSIKVSHLAGSPSSKTFKKLSSGTSYRLFAKDILKAGIDASDMASGIKSIAYYMSIKRYTWDGLEAISGWKNYHKNLTITGDQNVILYARLTDRAGNVSYISSENIVLDQTPPKAKISITPARASYGRGIYSAADKPGIDIKVEDPSLNSAYSGLKKISYSIKDIESGKEETGTLASYQKGSHRKTYTGHISIDPERFCSNKVVVTVTALDFSGNKAEKSSRYIKIDIKAPLITFQFSKSDAENKKYYRSTKKLFITVEETNFDTSCTPVVTASNKKGYSFSGWTVKDGKATGNITFSGDGDYAVSFSCRDLAGNLSNTEKLSGFTIDKTKPQVKVSYSPENGVSGTYFNETRTALLTVTDHNLSREDILPLIKSSLNGEDRKAPKIGAFKQKGDNFTARILYEEDGDYRFSIRVKDLAGNVSDTYPEDTFTVDRQFDDVKISGVKDQAAYKDELHPKITLTDANLKKGSAKVTVIGQKKGDVTEKLRMKESADGKTVEIADFPEDMDDIYTLTVDAADLAGNRISDNDKLAGKRQVTFCVNREGSVYTLSRETEDFLDGLKESGGFTKAPADIILTETNVTSPKSCRVTVYYNGHRFSYPEGKGEYVTSTSRGGEGSWYQRTVRISRAAFKEEGEYSVELYSLDGTGHHNTNTAAGKEIRFTVDRTPPALAFANLEKQAVYKEKDHTFRIIVADNMALSRVTYYVRKYKAALNDDNPDNDPAEEILQAPRTIDAASLADGVLEAKLESSFYRQDIVVTAVDKAGNQSEKIVMSGVLVSDKAWVRLAHSAAAMGIAVLGLLLIVTQCAKKGWLCS